MSLAKLVRELKKRREKIGEYLTPLLGLLEAPIEGELSAFQRLILFESVVALREELELLAKTIDRVSHEGELARRDGTTDELLERD